MNPSMMTTNSALAKFIQKRLNENNAFLLHDEWAVVIEAAIEEFEKEEANRSCPNCERDDSIYTNNTSYHCSMCDFYWKSLKEQDKESK